MPRSAIPAAAGGLPNITRRSAIALTGSGIAAGSSALSAVAAPPADDHLRFLAAEFDAAFEAEMGARNLAHQTKDWTEWEGAYAYTQTVVARIEATPVSTLEGLRLKARAVQWCYDDEPVTVFEDINTTDARLVKQILHSLLAL